KRPRANVDERLFTHAMTLHAFLSGHDLFGKPLHTPYQVRGRLFPDHALAVVPRREFIARRCRQTQGVAHAAKVGLFCWGMILSENRFTLFRDHALAAKILV